MTWNTHIACCITKAADTHSEYVILIVFPLQQWLHEGASMIPCTYIVCLAHFTCSMIGLTKAQHLVPLVTSARYWPGRNMLKERLHLPHPTLFRSVWFCFTHTSRDRERNVECASSLTQFTISTLPTLHCHIRQNDSRYAKTALYSRTITKFQY
jgi:hypothetical protein